MSDKNISQADYGNLTGTENLYQVPAASTDGQVDQKETRYYFTNWSKWFGYYVKIPELKASIDAIAKWTVGKGFTSDEITTLTLMKMKGFGKDCFNSILANMIRTYQINGDAFAEIIRDKDGYLVNLKPLDPSKIVIVSNREGLVIRYEQVTPVKDKVNTFKPEEILHLSRNRVADEIHGKSLVEAVEDIILARNEAMNDMRKLMHRHVHPIIKYQLDTDNPTKIAEFKAKADRASDYGENLYIPMGAVEADILAVAQNGTLNPLPWINQLNNYFFQATGVPQIIVGGSQEITEATAKIAYLAFEQTIEEEQLYIEEQILYQLNLEIELDFPATLQNDMITDKQKSESTQAATPEDTAVTGSTR